MGSPARIRFLEERAPRAGRAEQRLTANGQTISNLYSSTDGGLQWKQVVHFARNVSELCVLDARTLFVAGDDGFVSRTTDGGQSWQRLNTQCRGFINSVQFYNKRLGLLLSDFGVLILTQDGGETWKRISNRKKVGHLIAAALLSKTRIMLAANRGIYDLKL